ncbi:MULTISPECIES: prepilin-type N-terminal cleavage/methylation domain-containing protein [Rhodanobacter]|uniref:prepilin-type N-terminal cleavage/methylation domain-containing protein n=1 Tax=Rhodanobacter TaxID=75309 RepID=UPI000A65951F|nr:prepilin-type N-terminal cleavage/methylation domain-containing protein [Rhodanobacter thiooxydans]TAN19379.1 MAG: prepilin-type N-terminal cleavage/methylation domain-containing protein [Rhodanobacter sp.]UJJ56264.1 prepilin-type N-terminal cleavage/methylation domain-containing protein [Rhodanobacter thiooxydans]
MSKRHSPTRAACRGVAPAKPAAGFTLIELMVAMVLGLIVVGGVVSVFLANQRTYRTNQALGDVQDGSRLAFELMARDIREAGLTGCNNNGRVANVLNNQSTAWWADWGNAVHGYGVGTATADPALTVGTAATNQVGGTDSLQLIGAADSGLSVAATPSSTAANFKLNDKTSDIVTGDVVIVCDPDHAAIAQVTSYNSSNVTLVHNAGGSTVPGNCSKGLAFPTNCASPNGNGYAFGPNSQIFKLGAVDWYIGYNPLGGKSLYRVNVVTTAGAPTPTAQEMVRDVTGMVISYHQAGVASFVDAKTVAANWGAVDSVRVQLTVESVDKRAGTDTKPITRQFSATTTVRNRVP